MPHPLQDRRINPNRRARAPYNFVRLPDDIPQVPLELLPSHDRYHTGRLSGRIACRLTTASPLFIRAGQRREAFRRGDESRLQEEFFYLEDQGQPVIPASSLRGLFRTALEIVTFSKPGPIADERFAYRSVGGTSNHARSYRAMLVEEDPVNPLRMRPKMQAGYLHRHGRAWTITPARDTDQGYNWARVDNRRFNLRDFHRRLLNASGNAFKVFVALEQKQFHPVSHRYPGEMEYVEVGEMKDQPAAGLVEAALVLGGRMNNKHYEAVVMAEDRQAEPLSVCEDLVQLYRNQISGDHAQIVGVQGLLVDGQPVFYLPDPGNPRQALFFGNCLMFRLPYQQRVRDYLASKLKDDTVIDLAEAMFGYSKKDGEGKRRNYAGRLSFSSARLAEAAQPQWLSEQGFWMKILSEPKSTCFQHYLVQQNADQNALADYNAQPMRETALRGHKQYWHKGNPSLADLEGGQGNMAGRAKPLAAGNAFEFEIRFENLSPAELGALLWVLVIAGDERYRLKLGMGKPYGMGAAAVRIRSIKLEERALRYQRLLEGEGWYLPVKSKEETNKVCNDCLAAFEKFVIQALELEGKIDALDAHPRIAEYLRMLSWPGPDREETRYMEIEHPNPQSRGGRENEYKERKVLPSPLDLRLKSNDGKIA